MKVVILAGGFGTRLSEETDLLPKPMIEIGGKPIIWHIMKNFSHYGHKDFVILLGYKGYYIKEYFYNYMLHQSDITIDTKSGSFEVHNNFSEDWKVTLVDTGLETQTGGRILRAKKYIGQESFFLTYGDGVSDVNINSLHDFHKKNNKSLTITSVQPEGRFGALELSSDNQVHSFVEKPQGDGAWINGGFMVCENNVFNYIKNGDQTIFEREPLENLAKDGEIYSYKHTGFWKCMDTLRDKQLLNQMWNKNEAKWKTW
jgi:glucose-1-phosphate cytidylyltransferase